MVKVSGGILQARILECACHSLLRGDLSVLDPGIELGISHITGRIFTVWATSEAPPSFIFSAYLPGVPLTEPVPLIGTFLIILKVEPLPIMQLMCLESIASEFTLQFGHI